MGLGKVTQWSLAYFSLKKKVRNKAKLKFNRVGDV